MQGMGLVCARVLEAETQPEASDERVELRDWLLEDRAAGSNFTGDRVGVAEVEEIGNWLECKSLP